MGLALWVGLPRVVGVFVVVFGAMTVTGIVVGAKFVLVALVVV